MNVKDNIRKVIFADGEATIEQAVRIMIDAKISSVLITRQDEVIGLLTERDILRKISTLEVDQRLSRKVNTIMTRPIKYVRVNHILDDIKALHTSTKVRHFPIVKDQAAKIMTKDVVGILTLSDLARVYLMKMV